jgi:hypothetical protein
MTEILDPGRAGIPVVTITYPQTTAGFTSLEVKGPDLEAFSPVTVIMRPIKPVNEIQFPFTYL